jgi:outer membrane protein assembly factor BamB
MDCSRYFRLFLVTMAAVFHLAGASAQGQPPLNSSQNNQNLTVVTVRWGTRPGVTRYRLQLAKDSAFGDIVFDRLVSGQSYSVSDLAPGRYFWRVAALGARLGEFSSAGVIDVSAPPTNPVISETSKNRDPSKISTAGGWFAAIGTVSDPVLARLRSANALDVIGVNTDGRVFALDAARGVALWSTRVGNGSGPVLAPVTFRTQDGLDNVLVFSGNLATMLDGRSGREVWRSTLPGSANSAVTINSRVFIIDNSLVKLFIVDGIDGKLIAQSQLPRRAAGPPALLETEVIIALDDGSLQVIDQSGKLTRSADAGSPATTSPIFVRNARGGLVLVGTKNGLTALNAADLRPLGRVALKNDAPRGALSARDLDGDGIAEVLMFTDRGRVVVVKSDEGQILWEGDAKQAATAVFADVNKDRVLDLLLAGREGFAFALSGRDGALLWEETSGVATNHAPSSGRRSAQVAPFGTGVLLIAGDPTRGGLRAVEFSKATLPQN